MRSFTKKLESLLNLNNGRNKLLAKNVGLTSLFQLGAVFISIILLPISLSLLQVEVYGIWLTISSVLVWLGYLDLGLGSGLKNKLSESLAKSDYSKARKLISTAYFTIFLIMAVVAFFFILFSSRLNYFEIFGKPNPKIISSEILCKTVNVVAIVFFLRFILQLINPIMEAMQKLFWTKIIFFISQVVVLLSLLVVKYFLEPNIVILGIIFSLSPLLCILAGSFIFFAKNRNLRPSIFDVDFSLVKDIYSVGFKFLLIQINMLVLFQSSNFIIINFIGSSEVVKYNVVFNLFSMMNIAFSTIAAPYWAAYSNAWFQKDFVWIKSAQKKLLYVWLVIISISTIILLFSEYIYFLWIGNRVIIPFSLSLSVFIYMALFTFGMIYNTFVNSTGKVFLQTVSLTTLTFVYVPLVLLLIKYFQLGINSIPISLSIVALYTVFIAPVQSRKLLAGTAEGIFNR
jgi:O-antigen/teichoic acid export membrane protein